ncbi:MAG: DNA polymerase III subunit alpha [Spirochaetia bacterium]
MSDFVHLHNHSDYSLLDGAISIESLVGGAQAGGMKHLALTDHGNMFGTLKFYKLCREAGINPIIGSEFYVAPKSRHLKTGSDQTSRNNHMVLLAKNNTGYKNLLALSSLSYTEGFYYKPRIDLELLQKYSEGLIAMTACLAGEIPQLILRGAADKAEKKALFYRNLFGDGNFYLELQDHGIPEQKQANEGLAALSKKTGIPLVASNDVHYLNRDDAYAQDILLCIGTNKKINESGRMKFKGQEFYLKSGEEMRSIFRDHPEALENTVKIAESCDLSIDLPGPLLPDYKIPEEFDTPEAYLRSLTYRGLKERYGEITPEIKERCDYELSVIIEMGFTGYFLIVWDFINFAKKRNIPVGPGRGSGAGSITAYGLKITDIDPLKYDLLFERFLNPERVSMPDFDVDFCYEHRQDVIDYVTEKYGVSRVGQIITFGTLKARAVIRDVARVLDIPYAEADEIAKLVPEGPKVTLKKALDEEPKLKAVMNRGEVYRQLVSAATKLEGLHRHASTHAAGIVIGKKALTEYVPLYRDPKTGSVSTQFTMDQLEECGLVKMDFLGLKTLTLIRNTEKLIQRRGIEFDIEKIPEGDEKTFALLGEGKSKCVFQFDSDGMQGLLKRAKPQRIKDLIALNALYRPGPMAYIDQFVDSKSGITAIKYPLPQLESVLKETYGVIVYQEQVMEIARMVGGFSLGQADILRRAMGKKKEKEMAKYKVHFIEGAVKKGFTKKEAESIFELLIPFAGYGFNKCHAAPYSVLAYKTAYLKANYPAEFMAANLTNEIGNNKDFPVYLEESRIMGIEILPPDINKSDKFFTVNNGKIVYGLMGIKSVGPAAVDEILRERNANGPFTSFFDFLDRVDLKTVNRKVIETAIQSGLFINLYPNRATLLANLDMCLEHAAKKKESTAFGQASLFNENEEDAFGDPELSEVPEWEADEILRLEKENLGFFVTGHPLDGYRERWEKTVTLDLSAPQRYSPETKYNLLGLLKELKTIQTKKGGRMAFGILEDFRGTIELVFFTETYDQYQHLLAVDAITGIIGKVEERRGKLQVIVDQACGPEDLTEKEAGEVHIRIPEELESEEELYQLRAHLFENSGVCPVYIHIRQNGSGKDSVIRASSQIKVSSQRDVLSRIKDHPRVLEVWTQ